MSSPCSRCVPGTGNGADFEKKDPRHDRTPLMRASYDGHAECMKFLLDTELIDDINRTDSHGSTALMLASMQGHFECVKHLLDTGLVDVNIENSDCSTAFALAAENGHVECVECFLNRGLVDDINKVDSLGSTAFMVAAKNGHAECVACFLKKGFVDDINKENYDGFTALMLASMNGHAACVKCLLNSGMMIDINKTTTGWLEVTALMLASENGHVTIVDILLDSGAVDRVEAGKTRTTPLMLASENGHVECVKMLLEKGLQDANVEDSMGYTALIFAAKRGHSECVKCLLDTGLLQDIDKSNRFDGKTAFILAAENGHLESVKRLLDTGRVNVNQQSTCIYEATALMLAAQNGHVECVAYLLDTGLVDINYANSAGTTAFMLAVSHLECIKFLLDTGLIEDVNRQNKCGSTAFMLAAESGHSECVKYLLDTGLVDDVNTEDHKGRTAVTLAVRNGHLECAKLLLETGLVNDVNKEDESGNTPLMILVIRGMANMINCLLDMGLVKNLNKGDSFGRTAFELAGRWGRTHCLPCFFDISVVASEIPSYDDSQDVSSVSLFVPNGSMTSFTYAPGITWKSPYVYGRDQQGPSVLKLVVGRGLSRCVVCFLLGNLEVPLTQHSVCRHEGLEYSAPTVRGDLCIKPPSIITIPTDNDYVDYVLQFERIRLHTLVILLREEYARTSQISLGLYQKLCHLIWNYDNVDYFLGMMCAGRHQGRCVDFLLSVFICQHDESGYHTFSHASMEESGECFGQLVQHVFVEEGRPLPDACKQAFVVVSRDEVSQRLYDGLNERLDSFLGNGVFRWSWYTEFHQVRHLARALVIHGYIPGEFEWRGKPSSPLHHAFMTGDEGLVRYLVSNLYLTSRDANHFQTDTHLRDHVLGKGSEKLQSLYRQIFVEIPWRLQALSFVKVSTILGGTVRREDAAPVDGLPIPQAFKRRLSFVHPNRMVEATEWDNLEPNRYI